MIATEKRRVRIPSGELAVVEAGDPEAPPVVLLSYLILVIGRLADAVSFVKYISAYYYYGFAILQGVWWGGVAVLLSATTVLLIIAILTFNRRDIYA